MKPFGKEFLVGALVLVAFGLMVVFGWLLGVIGPFQREMHYELLYAFAGGVEVGSPVRVSGIKVGKVDSIAFLPHPESAGGDRVTVKVIISVATKAASAVRADSRFFINMAGIIGERYIEISPGSESSPVLAPGSQVRGVDPPRIDQLLSQGYGVFGRVQDFLEQNEKLVTEFLSQTTKLLRDANQLLKGDDRRKLLTLVDNLTVITDDVKQLTRRLTTKEADDAYTEFRDLLRRAHKADKESIKKFFQDEGIRARIF